MPCLHRTWHSNHHEKVPKKLTCKHVTGVVNFQFFTRQRRICTKFQTQDLSNNLSMTLMPVEARS